MIALIVLAAVGALALLCMVRAVRVVPQARAYVVERLGSYHRTLQVLNDSQADHVQGGGRRGR